MSINWNGSIRSIALIDTSTMWRMAFNFFEILRPYRHLELITLLYTYTLPASELIKWASKAKFLEKPAVRVHFVTFSHNHQALNILAFVMKLWTFQ